MLHIFTEISAKSHTSPCISLPSIFHAVPKHKCWILRVNQWDYLQKFDNSRRTTLSLNWKEVLMNLQLGYSDMVCGGIMVVTKNCLTVTFIESVAFSCYRLKSANCARDFSSVFCSFYVLQLMLYTWKVEFIVSHYGTSFQH